jgi:hypothetical protein
VCLYVELERFLFVSMIACSSCYVFAVSEPYLQIGKTCKNDEVHFSLFVYYLFVRAD